MNNAYQDMWSSTQLDKQHLTVYGWIMGAFRAYEPSFNYPQKAQTIIQS